MRTWRKDGYRGLWKQLPDGGRVGVDLRFGSFTAPLRYRLLYYALRLIGR